MLSYERDRSNLLEVKAEPVQDSGEWIVNLMSHTSDKFGNLFEPLDDSREFRSDGLVFAGWEPFPIRSSSLRERLLD